MLFNLFFVNFIVAYVPSKINFVRIRKGRNVGSKIVRFLSSRADEHKSTDKFVESSSETNGKFVKRKVAMVFSYVGSAYNGLQFNPILEFITIESEIQKALFAVGCIKLTNLNDPNKIGWSRSSRVSPPSPFRHLV